MSKLTKSKNSANVVVIGAGPAGMFAALSAARSGAHVTILEKLQAPGRKLLASGGGHCNITNTLPLSDFIARFGKKGRFITHALHELSSGKLLSLLKSLGVPCLAMDGFHYFPESNKAADVLNAITRELNLLEVKLFTGVEVLDLVACKEGVCVKASGKNAFDTDRVIIASGGASYPGLGGSSSGYRLVRKTGHSIVDPVPGLLGLRTKESWTAGCAGITVSDAELIVMDRLFKNQKWRGELLFTHDGVSGPCVLDASASICRLLLDNKEIKIKICLADCARGKEEWHRVFTGWRQEHGKRTVYNSVAAIMPQRLASVICSICGVSGDQIMARLSKQEEKDLSDVLDGVVLTITGSGGFEQAMVTSGGVSLKEVDPATMRSEIMPELYFAGEVLDIDGPCGGFNLQWSASSGWLAGRCAAEKAVNR